MQIFEKPYKIFICTFSTYQIRKYSNQNNINNLENPYIFPIKRFNPIIFYPYKKDNYFNKYNFVSSAALVIHLYKVENT